MADCLNNEEQVTSNLDSKNQDSLNSNLDTGNAITSDIVSDGVLVSNTNSGESVSSVLELGEALTSQLDLPVTHTYRGAETDNIVVSVDNNAYTISATLKQIKFKTVADFPVVGSDKLIYIDASNNSLYSWDFATQTYSQLVAGGGGGESYDDTELRNLITGLEESKASNTEVAETLRSAKGYTDTKVSELIDSAPETLDTFKEIADAFKENDEVLDALNSAIGKKVDKEEGKGLSTNDYTTAEKTKLAGIEEGANNYDDIEIRRSLFGKADKSDTYTKTEVDELITEAGGVIVDDVLSETSENPIQNKVVTNALANTVTIDTEQTITASKTLEYCGLKHTTIANPSSSNASIFSSFPSVYDRNGNNLGGMEFQYNNLNKWFGMALYAGVANDVHLYPNKSLGIYKDANGNTITQAPTPSGNNNNEIATTGYVNASLGEYVTESELNSKGYLTSVPSEYVTETELNNKNYIDTTELENRLSNFTSGTQIIWEVWE